MTAVSPHDPKSLFEKNQALAYWAASKWTMYPKHSPDWEDACQVALMAVWRAAEKFDPTKGFKFTTFASTCCFHAIIHHRRAADRNGLTYLNGATPTRVEIDAFENPDAVHPAVDWEPQVEVRDEMAVVAKAARFLPERERKVLALQLAGVTAREMGKRVGMSPQGVLNVAAGVRAAVRELVEKRGWELRCGSPGCRAVLAAPTQDQYGKAARGLNVYCRKRCRLDAMNARHMAERHAALAAEPPVACHWCRGRFRGTARQVAMFKRGRPVHCCRAHQVAALYAVTGRAERRRAAEAEAAVAPTIPCSGCGTPFPATTQKRGMAKAGRRVYCAAACRTRHEHAGKRAARKESRLSQIATTEPVVWETPGGVGA